MAVRLTYYRAGEAEDMVHDTWIRDSECWHDFAWRSSLRTWLTGILLNRVREVRRRWNALPVDPLFDIASDSPPIDAHLDLEAAIASLPSGYRTIVVLHDIEGRTHAETAEQVGIEVGTSRSQLSKARETLRCWLEPHRREP